MLKVKIILTLVMLTLLILLAGSVKYYHYHWHAAKKQAGEAALLAEERKQIISNFKLRQQEAAELDARHIKELSHARNDIEHLQAAVATGHRRLRIRAACRTGAASTSGSVGNATTPRFTPAAEQDYFTLRRMMAENVQQTQYLQDYITSQCQ